MLPRRSPDKHQDAYGYLDNRGILKLKNDWGELIKMDINLVFRTSKVSHTKGHTIQSRLMHEICVEARQDEDEDEGSE